MWCPVRALSVWMKYVRKAAVISSAHVQLPRCAEMKPNETDNKVETNQLIKSSWTIVDNTSFLMPLFQWHYSKLIHPRVSIKKGLKLEERSNFHSFFVFLF